MIQPEDGRGARALVLPKRPRLPQLGGGAAEVETVQQWCAQHACQHFYQHHQIAQRSAEPLQCNPTSLMPLFPQTTTSLAFLPIYLTQVKFKITGSQYPQISSRKCFAHSAILQGESSVELDLQDAR